VIAQYPHTGELVHAIDEYRSEQGELQGRAAQLDHRFHQLVKKNKAFTNEVDQILRAQDNGQPLPTNMSLQAKEWLQIANNGMHRDIGNE
jgi:hypothetical protein